MRKLIVGLLLVVFVIGYIQKEGDVETREYPICQEVPPDSYLSVAGKKLFLRTGASPLKRGRIYELTYRREDGMITAARDVRETICEIK